jgi:hypothetical protein
MLEFVRRDDEDAIAHDPLRMLNAIHDVSTIIEVVSGDVRLYASKKIRAEVEFYCVVGWSSFRSTIVCTQETNARRSMEMQ